MKYTLLTLLIGILFTGCKSDDDQLQENPNLFDPIVNFTLNLNLPEYNGLKFSGNSYIAQNQGIGGIVIYNVNNELYTAFDLSDPNHPPNDCSRMTVEGVVASCLCTTDENRYEIVSGQSQNNPDTYPMQQYRIVRNGNTLQVSN